jgi:hypothetical protein
MVQKEFIVSLHDLRYVSITCPNCRTIVTLDMKEPSEFNKKHGAFAPKECPGCRINYDTAIQPAVDGFQRSYQSLAEIADRISFRSIPSASSEV